LLPPRRARRVVMRTGEMVIAKVVIWIEKGIGIIIKWIVIIWFGIGLNL